MEQDEMNNIKLTDSQDRVLNKILNFVNNSADRVFILKGYAGTGKTTLMRFLIQKLDQQEKNYRLLASTGRAAKVLANISGTGFITSTIHSLIYTFKGLNRDTEGIDEAQIDENGTPIILMFQQAKLDEENQPEAIYIVDESSMVSDVPSRDVTQAQFGDGRLLKNLLDYDPRPGSKFIFVGDPCQLPPIKEYYSPALIPAYFQQTFNLNAQEEKLTEIMRQKGVSGIIDASKKIRGLYTTAPEAGGLFGKQKLWGYLPFRGNKDIQLHKNTEVMLDDYVEKVKASGLNSAVCICRSNRMCGELSRTIRQKLGFISERISVGDLLLVTQNNISTGLMNGDMVTVEEIAPHVQTRARLTFRQMKLKELFTQRTYTTLVIEEIAYQGRLNLDAQQQQALFVDFIIRMRKKGITEKKNRLAFYSAMENDPYLNALRCVYGYAITCHKSQGGEWEDVYVQVPRNIPLNPTKGTYQWIYTAMTRARPTLHVVDDFYLR